MGGRAGGRGKRVGRGWTTGVRRVGGQFETGNTEITVGLLITDVSVFEIFSGLANSGADL